MAVITAIVKTVPELEVTPNLSDYESARTPDFWERAREELDGLPSHRGLNIAHEAVDRHAYGARAEHLALRCLANRGEVRNLTYAELGRETSRFANALQSLGVGEGGPRGVLAGRIPELYVAALGTLIHGSDMLEHAAEQMRGTTDHEVSVYPDDRVAPALQARLA